MTKMCFVHDSRFQVVDIPIGIHTNGLYTWVTINQEVKLAVCIPRHCKQKLEGWVIEGKAIKLEFVLLLLVSKTTRDRVKRFMTRLTFSISISYLEVA